jgi:CBS domain-containing protein
MQMNVGAVCTRDVIIAEGTETVLDVAKLMRAHHVGDVVIVESREGVRYPTGILTDRDIVVEGVVEVLERLPRLRADDLVTRPLVTVSERDNVDHAIEIMRAQGVRRLPVVDDVGALVGLLAFDDLVEFFAGRLAGLAAVVAGEERMERDYRP